MGLSNRKYLHMPFAIVTKDFNLEMNLTDGYTPLMAVTLLRWCLRGSGICKKHFMFLNRTYVRTHLIIFIKIFIKDVFLQYIWDSAL